MADINLNKPQNNEIEISLFGKGVGESIVIHLGNNKWVVIDSCICPDSKKSIALKYLSDLGVDVANNVELIIITHWHDDHIGGIAEVIETCSSALVAIPDAFRSDEILKLTAIDKETTQVSDRESHRMKEFSKVIEIISSAPDINKRLLTVKAGQVLFQGDTSTNSHLRALSPSQHDHTQALTFFREAFEAYIKSEYRISIQRPTDEPNHTALAVHAKLDNLIALLGSDLEVTSSKLSGWKAVLESTLRPQEKADIFKVAHHGSSNAHSDKVIHEMITPKPISILTTFNKGSSPLPKQEDIERIKGFSSATYATTSPKSSITRDKLVAKTLRRRGIKLTTISNKIGHIQIRSDSENTLTILTNDYARKL